MRKKIRTWLPTLPAKLWAALVVSGFWVLQIALDRFIKLYIPEGQEAGHASRALQWLRELLNSIPVGYFVVAATTAALLYAWDDRLRIAQVFSRLLGTVAFGLQWVFKPWFAHTQPSSSMTLVWGGHTEAPRRTPEFGYELAQRVRVIDTALALLGTEMDAILLRATRIQTEAYRAFREPERGEQYLSDVRELGQSLRRLREKFATLSISNPQHDDITPDASPIYHLASNVEGLWVRWQELVDYLNENTHCDAFMRLMGDGTRDVEAMIQRVSRWRNENRDRLLSKRREIVGS
jgi:hypothetical protein